MKSDLGLQSPRSITERGVFITSVMQAMQRIFNRTVVVQIWGVIHFFENNDLILSKKLFLYGADVGKGSFNTQGKFIL